MMEERRFVVIQWVRSWIPSNSLACLYAIARDAAERKTLGPDVAIEINAYDECHTLIPIKRIIRRINAADGGLVCLVGVQSNQFPRAVDIARQFRAAGVQVAIGGFHVSGCISMLPELPPDIAEARDIGIALFAGEAEGRLDRVFADALAGELQPIYNFMNDLPGLQEQVSAVSARSSTCKGESLAGATPTMSSVWCAPISHRVCVASLSPTTISRATATGKRSLTG
jgi:hypothetical protein